MAGSAQLGDRGATTVSATAPAPPTGLGSTFRAALQKLNDINAEAGALTVAYEKGETTDIAQVMLTSQRSSIAFEATLQVRNKLLSAYKDIMSMPI